VYFGSGKPAAAGEERFRSLTELKLGEFEATGFRGLDLAEKKLYRKYPDDPSRYRLCSVTNVHLPCCSREPRNERRSLGRISRPLDSVSPTRHATERDATIRHPPRKFNIVLAGQQADITRELKKTQKSLPPFGWDTEPVLGTEVIVEEAFIDRFCDLMYGGGWMEI